MKFSIIIAGFNCENTIVDTLQSCIEASKNGTLCDEIIYFDDGSSDQSLKLVSEMSIPIDNPIKIKAYSSNKNMGVSFARNTAVQNATNELIALIDSDDLMTENRLIEQVKYFEENTDLAFLSGGAVLAFRYYLTQFIPNAGFLIKRDLIHNPVINPTLSFRKKDFIDLKGYDEKNRYMTEDLDLSYRVLKNRKQFYISNQIWCIYRERQTARKLGTYINILKIHIKNVNNVHMATILFLKDILVLCGLYKPRSWI